MVSESSPTHGGQGGPNRRLELIPREFLRAIAVWSLVPSYLVAGGILGYLVDRGFGWFPYATGIGLVIALIFAVRDMMRLRDEM